MQLTGTIPTELSQLSGLEDLALHVNELTGTIPEGISELSYLLYFDVSNNNLTGEVPSLESVSTGYFDEGKNYHYPFIGVYNNSFSGVIPQDLCYLEPEGFLGFDCSDILCGCSCNCSGTVSSNATPQDASSMNTTEEATNTTNTTNLII